MSTGEEGTAAAQEEERLEEATLLSHLVELRSRLLKATIAVLVIFVCLAPFAAEIFSLVATPLVNVLPEGNSMIATRPASPLLTPFKLSFFIALFLGMPVVLYQTWAFIAPGLYKREKRVAVPLLASSIVLFYLGIAFAYFVVFPLMFGFFTAVAPTDVAVMTDIEEYLSFIITIFFAFGLAFEVPIATVLLVWAGFTTPEKLGKARAYVFLAAFVLGMILTPPDMISQTLLAIPVYLLYEAGIFMSKVLVKRSSRREETDPDTGGEG
ncbi:twin-arginine translocase subunit TatC [Lentisalinibacter salinarum]|uniref:twin-arginine translocase subunit TatC n=1 Tax=Lentisalinibacter salinarum TaxID=2992239 RepID=UPI00386C33E3